jgi:hypothetical protein
MKPHAVSCEPHAPITWTALLAIEFRARRLSTFLSSTVMSPRLNRPHPTAMLQSISPVLSILLLCIISVL